MALLDHTPRLHEHQIPYPDNWRTWVLLGGRGSGKTYAGARWLNDLALAKGLTLALIGPALHDVREVMVEGPSGLKETAPRGNRPRWEAGRKRLIWPSETVAYAFSAEDPDSLRGPQFHAAWADEYCAWRTPEKTLSNLRFGLRLGQDPRLMVTTTPRPMGALRRLLAEPGVRIDRGATEANVEHLSPGFMEHLNTLYGGTSMAAQELEGLIVETDGALFKAADLARARGARPPKLDKIVVAVDPPATAHGDACGIVVAGRLDRSAFVLADRSRAGLTPEGWARATVAAAAEFGADQVVAEANQGGEMRRISWIARNRMGGDVWEGEAAASDPMRFRLRVRDSVAVLRVFEVEATEAVYGAADLAADFPGGIGEDAWVDVAQADSRMGWGRNATIRLVG